MAIELFKLFGTIAVNTDQADKDLDGINNKAKESEGALSKLGNAGHAVGNALKVGAAAGAVALAGIGAASIKMAADFESSMREVNSLINLPEQQFKDLKQSVLDMSAELGIATTDAVPALYNAISAGVPADNAVDFLRVASKASIAGVTDLNTAVNGLTTALNAYQLPASQAEHVSDVLFSAVKAGKTTMQEMSDSLFNVAPLANAAGISLEETAASMAALTTAGTPTTVAATQVRAAIQGILKPGDELTAIFNKAGYESGQAAIQQVGLAGAMDVLQKAAGGDVGELTRLVGSIEGTQAILSLTGAQAGVFTTTLDTMKNGTGQTQLAFEEMNKSASRQWAIFNNQLKVAMIEFGSLLLPVLTSALKSLTPVFQSLISNLITFAQYIAYTVQTGDSMNDWLTHLSPSLQGVAQAIGAVVVVFRDELVPAFLTGLSIIGPLVLDFFNFIIDNKPLLVAAIIAIGAAVVLSLGPVSATVLAITGFITLVGLVAQNIDWLKAKFDEVFNSLPGPVQAAMAFIYSDVVAKISGIVQSFQGMWTAIQGVINLIDDIIHGRWSQILGDLEQIARGILDSLIGMFRTQYGRIPDIIYGAMLDAAHAARQFAESIYNAIVGWLEKLPAKAAGIFADIAKAAANAIPGAGIVAGAAGALGNVLGHAAGGRNLPAGWSWVGEAGPELAYLPRGTDIYSNQESVGMMQAAGGVNVYIDQVVATSPAEATSRGNDIGWAIKSRGLQKI